ncbi:hypothetical protein CHT98_02970 [Azospirillum brasilense]|uniref:Uncharacterized protein n=1 Tax=Azospirillum brasilense TaxID=192 RepID=A0A235HIR0_AZOBR|nr:hypothetical protein CHT98_02970 [Azospirillum brasilense]
MMTSIFLAIRFYLISIRSKSSLSARYKSITEMIFIGISIQNFIKPEVQTPIKTIWAAIAVI